MFGKKKEEIQKMKTEKELKQEQEAFDKKQVDLLVALRTKSELKIEKSAIVTLGQMSNVVRSQTLVNKSLQNELNQSKNNFVKYNKEISTLLKKTFDNVDSMKANIKILVDKY